MPDAFVRAIVQIHKPGLPIARQVIGLHDVSVILTCDVAATRQQILHGLVHRPVPKFHLVRLCTSGESQDLVTKTDAKNGKVFMKERSNAIHKGTRVHWIAGAIGQKNTVYFRQVVFPSRVPRRPYDFDVSRD
jgi:hypothetical protein